MLLNDPADFEGGGTRIESLNATVKPERAGDVFMHSGQMLHGGTAVTEGVRYILVAFIDIVKPNVLEIISEMDEDDVEGAEDDVEQEERAVEDVADEVEGAAVEQEEEEEEEEEEEDDGISPAEDAAKDHSVLQKYWSVIQSVEWV